VDLDLLDDVRGTGACTGRAGWSERGGWVEVGEVRGGGQDGLGGEQAACGGGWAGGAGRREAAGRRWPKCAAVGARLEWWWRWWRGVPRPRRSADMLSWVAPGPGVHMT
jgi:hypothetical protein